MTAVEFLIEQILKHDKSFIEFYNAEIQQAKEMEKQQIEKMYSEEEVIDLLAKFRRENRGKDSIPFKDIQEWFEQFKKDKL
jgi:hypothetical protein